jgi:hypothetical protein
MAIFEHDCTKCKKLGDFSFMDETHGKLVVDLYFCDNAYGGTYIARYGDEGPEYTSVPAIMISQLGNGKSTYDVAILEAYNRNSGE